MGKKLWITTGIIGALAAAYTAGGFLGVPYGVNWALKKYAEPIVGRTITTQEQDRGSGLLNNVYC